MPEHDDGSSAAADDAAAAADTARLPAEAAPWYAEGLTFECQWPSCTACCGGEPGFVWLSPGEADSIAAEKGLTRDEFLATYARKVHGRHSLSECDNGDCVLLGETGCTIYGARPAQCASYPFWPEIVATPDTWQAEKAYCPGIGQGPVRSREEIEARVRMKPSQPTRWVDDLPLAESRARIRSAVAPQAADDDRDASS